MANKNAPTEDELREARKRGASDALSYKPKEKHDALMARHAVGDKNREKHIAHVRNIAKS